MLICNIFLKNVVIRACEWYTMAYMRKKEIQMIFLGADHRGYDLKEKIKKYFDEKDIEYVDCGTNSKEITHYPLIAKKVCTSLNLEKDEAILVCGSGIGMGIVANKFKGIRAGVCLDEESAKHGKEMDHTNVLILSGDWLDIDKAISIIEVWQKSECLDGRYMDRQKMIEEIEKENMK